MTVEEVFSYLERSVAPVKLSDDFCAAYKMYDNSGIIINCGKPVTGALFSLDLSEAAVEEAVKLGYNLVVTHHPAIYGGVSRFDLANIPQSRALATCLKHGISVISMHLNLDAAPRGIDYYLMRGLGGTDGKVLCKIQDGGYGRVYEIAPITIEEFLKNIEKNFNTRRAVCHGDNSGTVKKVASFCGAGCDENSIAFAKAEKADAFVSSDLKHHQICELVESGITVVQLTHYSAEAYGFKRVYEDIKDGLSVPSSLFFDGRFA